MALAQGSRIDVVYRLKAKTNPQFPGLELELIDIRAVEGANGNPSDLGAIHPR
jgi:single-stranded-DNA-specific exonuclease